jgi:hypothetical protein
MYFVVYQVKSGRTVAVYERESSAKARVTRNNKELMIKLLRGAENRYSWDRMEEWAYCSYVDYAPHFYRYNKSRG